MTDESDAIAVKTWQRTVDPITKAGYMDGAADGQESTFQSSFDKGYKLGLCYGLEFGIKEAIHSIKPSTHKTELLQDPRKINCQICLDNSLLKDSVDNLYDLQKEKNDRLVKANEINDVR